MKPAPFAYERPGSLAEACALLAEGGAKLLAGGQSLGPMLNLRLVQPEMLVDLAGLDELKASERLVDGARLGALVTHAQIEDGRAPDPTGGILPRVACGIAYRAIRNRGTVGGSLAHADPAADWLTVLAALGATAIVTGADGERRVPVAEFATGAFETVLGEAEILAAVAIPTVAAGARWGYVKIARKPGEFADAMAAVLRDPERDVERVVVGATHGAPIIVEDFSEAVLAESLARFDPIARRLCRAAVRRALAEADA
ncbi:MAG TPA: FAD binding domain-containing protein [Stellaceae bacterium]|nr:FAD binding domain-containing protein [Stellaceae bacterium]